METEIHLQSVFITHLISRHAIKSNDICPKSLQFLLQSYIIAVVVKALLLTKMQNLCACYQYVAAKCLMGKIF